MSKSKRARTRKTGSAGKARSRVGGRKIVSHHSARADSKQTRVLELLCRSGGATIATIMDSTGWRLLAERYDDGGLSGASLERPALQGLLADVRSRRIDIVVVYKVDRLTRSLVDFAKLIELFDAHDVSFGDAILQHQLQHGAAHAQRAVVLCPVRARADRGVGARQDRGLQAQGPLGRGPGPARYAQWTRRVVVPVEAEAVRTIFERYLELGSVRTLADDLDRRGIPARHERYGHGGIPKSRPAPTMAGKPP
jgi:site-specific DNA recombinase